MSNKHIYEPLPQHLPSDSEYAGTVDIDDVDVKPTKRHRWLFLINTTSHIVAWMVVVALLFSDARSRLWGWDRFNQHKMFPAQLTYSPAQESIEYEVRVFEQGIEAVPGGLAPEFQGPPSDELDRAWSDLYNFGMSAISRQQASYLPNKTSPIPAIPDKYVVQLDVFHQLHCLNRLRKALNPYYFCPTDNSHCDDHREMSVAYDSPEDIGPHLSHCLHSLRQSLMCSVDIAPVVWHKSATAGHDGKFINQGFLSVAHTCRNFDRVREWAIEKQIHVPLDFNVIPPEDGIAIPVFP